MNEDWKAKKLGTICRVINGRAYRRTDLLPKGKYRVLRVGNLFTNKHWYYSDMELDEDKYCEANDLIYAWSASFGPRIWDGEKVIYHYHIWKMVPNEEQILKEFLFKYLLWDTEKLKSEQGVGTTMVHVTKKSIEAREIPIPPLPEQKQIVAILDEAFEAIDQAKANIEKNIQNARELFQSKLNEIFSQDEGGWIERKLGDETLLKMIDGDRGKNYPKKSDFLTQGHCVFMNTGNVRPYGFDFSNVVFISKERDYLLRKGKLQREDVVMTTRGTIGNLGWYNSDVEFEHIRINSGMLIFRVNNSQILPEYLFTLFRSSIVTKQIIDKTSGAAQPQLPIKTLSEFKIPINPNLEAQKRMVNKIQKVELINEKLIKIYKNKLVNLDNFKKSLLQKAFSGELTKSFSEDVKDLITS